MDHEEQNEQNQRKRKIDDLENNHSASVEEDSDESEEEWEEVNPIESHVITTSSINEIQHSEQTIEIQLPNTNRRKTGIKNSDRLKQLNFHQAHLLCLLSSCIHMNQWCNDPIIQNIAFSLLPTHLLKTNFTVVKNFKKLFSFWIDTVECDKKINPKLDDGIDSLYCTFNNGHEPISGVVSTIFFVALCRTMKLNTRLIASLHPLPISLSKKHKQARFPLRLWCEVDIDNRWIPVDPVDKKIDELGITSEVAHSYIVSCEAVFGVKDVTRRYCTSWGAETSKLRSEEWWNQTVWLYSKSDRTDRDHLDDCNLVKSQLAEKMPSSLEKFINHPLYALERHCKRNEIIYPNGKKHSIGRYKNELVYPRTLVQKLFTEEGWKRQGRVLKDNSIPLKTIPKAKSRKANQSTEELETESQLFAHFQTDDWPVAVIENGIIPKNQYGNIEIFHESMRPIGSIHIKDNRYAPIARKLKIDFAKVVVGFEFTKGQTVPTYEGILVGEESEDLLHSAFIDEMHLKKRNDMKKKEKLVLTRWKKITLGLLLKNRLENEYMKK
ncbi:hypothetical protein BC833DRAFT_549073 [Globomyces pollinis-pini]|nr:hypothetical protein BC833DRAFT_549073 [Globomyces pollinis-pini]